MKIVIDLSPTELEQALNKSQAEGNDSDKTLRGENLKLTNRISYLESELAKKIDICNSRKQDIQSLTAALEAKVDECLKLRSKIKQAESMLVYLPVCRNIIEALRDPEKRETVFGPGCTYLNKIGLIKKVRELSYVSSSRQMVRQACPGLSLREAKDLVEAILFPTEYAYNGPHSELAVALLEACPAKD